MECPENSLLIYCDDHTVDAQGKKTNDEDVEDNGNAIEEPPLTVVPVHLIRPRCHLFAEKHERNENENNQFLK